MFSTLRSRIGYEMEAGCCNTRPGPAYAIGFYREQTGVEMTEQDWHACVKAAEEALGRKLSRSRADSMAAVNAALALAQSLDANEADTEAFVTVFRDSKPTVGNVDTVNHIADNGLPASVEDRKRRGDGLPRGTQRCDTCGQFAKLDEHTCDPAEVEKYAARQDALAREEARFLEAVEAIQTDEQFVAALDFASKVHGYSLGNALLLMGEHHRRRELDPSLPADPGVFMAYSKWTDVDRHVVKGAKGYPILAPNTRTSYYYVDPSGKRVYLAYGEKAPDGVKVEKQVYVKGFSVAKTFPAYLTDGEPIPEPPRPKFLQGEGIEGLNDKVIGLAEGLGYTVEFVPPNDPRLYGANGVTSPGTMTMLVRNDTSKAQMQKTLLHEYAHAALGHTDEGFSYAQHRGIAEVQAEAAAYLTVKTLCPDADTSDYSIPYAANWMTAIKGTAEERSRQAREALGAVSKVADSIVSLYWSKPEPKKKAAKPAKKRAARKKPAKA